MGLRSWDHLIRFQYQLTKLSWLDHPYPAFFSTPSPSPEPYPFSNSWICLRSQEECWGLSVCTPSSSYSIMYLYTIVSSLDLWEPCFVALEFVRSWAYMGLHLLNSNKRAMIQEHEEGAREMGIGDKDNTGLWTVWEGARGPALPLVPEWRTRVKTCYRSLHTYNWWE